MASVANIFQSLTGPGSQGAGINPIHSGQQPAELFASLLAAIGHETGAPDAAQSENSTNTGGQVSGNDAAATPHPFAWTSAGPIAGQGANSPLATPPGETVKPLEGHGPILGQVAPAPGQSDADGQEDLIANAASPTRDPSALPVQIGLEANGQNASIEAPIAADQAEAVGEIVKDNTTGEKPAIPFATQSDARPSNAADHPDTGKGQHRRPTEAEPVRLTGLDRASERVGDGAGRTGLDVAHRAIGGNTGAAPSNGENPGKSEQIDFQSKRLAQVIPPHALGRQANGANADSTKTFGAPTPEQAVTSQTSMGNGSTFAPNRSQNAINLGIHDGVLAIQNGGDIEALAPMGRDIASQGIQFRGLASPVVSQPQAPQVPLNALAVHIAQQAQAGAKRFDIRLDPPELGRLEIRLDVARDGRATTHLVVERAETLDLLQRDARSLERALQNAGLDTSKDGLTFSLKDQQTGGNGPRESDTPGMNKVAGESQVTDANDDGAEPLDGWQNRYRSYVASDRVDIRI